jgi:hypothetical protein
MKVPVNVLLGFDKSSLDKLNKILLTLTSAINCIEFGDGTTSENMLCAFAHVLTPSTAVPFSAVHTLGRTPIGVIPISINTNSGVDSYCDFSVVAGSAHDSTKIYLNASATGTSATLIVI